MFANRCCVNILRLFSGERFTGNVSLGETDFKGCSLRDISLVMMALRDLQFSLVRCTTFTMFQRFELKDDWLKMLTRKHNKKREELK